MNTDFEKLRTFIFKLPASPPIRRARLHLFDMYRYSEDYEQLYKYVKELGGQIE